jgi:hypothetical protein
MGDDVYHAREFDLLLRILDELIQHVKLRAQAGEGVKRGCGRGRGEFMPTLGAEGTGG